MDNVREIIAATLLTHLDRKRKRPAKRYVIEAAIVSEKQRARHPSGWIPVMETVGKRRTTAKRHLVANGMAWLANGKRAWRVVATRAPR